MIIIYIFLLIIAVFVIMSFFSLKKLNKQSNSNHNLSDDRYYELKYKLQFISSIGVIIIGVCGFLGYDKFENFVENFEKKTDSLNSKIKGYDNRISIMDKNIAKYDSKIIAYSNILNKLNNGKIQFSKAMIASNKQLLTLNDTIDIIKKRNVLDKSFYVIDNLQISNHIINNVRVEINKKYYFKDMTTIIGDKLPVFSKKPVVFVIPQSGADISLKEITTEYIEVDYGTYNPHGVKDIKSFAFGLLIARKLE